MVTDGVDKLAFHGRIGGDTPGGRFETAVVEFWRFDNDKAIEIVVCWHDTKAVMDLMAAGANQ
jgi:hypothetical protein